MTFSDDEITKEMESWRSFENALRAEDRELFREMLRLCYEYAPSMNAKLSPFPSEKVFMSLIFAQHKMIKLLLKEIEELKKVFHVAGLGI